MIRIHFHTGLQEGRHQATVVQDHKVCFKQGRSPTMTLCACSNRSGGASSPSPPGLFLKLSSECKDGLTVLFRAQNEL